MRITSSMLINALSGGLARSTARLNDASRVASSGTRVSVPSDDPSAYAVGVALTAQLSAIDARSKTATIVRGDLELAETSLQSSADLLQRAKEIATMAANGSVDPTTRANLASEVAGLKQSLIGYANARGANGYLFGGTKTDTAPFDSSGNFLGNSSATTFEVSSGVVMNANVSGAAAFTSTTGGRNLFADLDALSTALTANDTSAIISSISTFDTGQTQLFRVQSEAGFSMQRVDSAAELATNATLLLQKAKSSATEADATQAYSDLVAATNAYQRGVAVTKQLLSLTSLLTQ